jgi:integrase
VARRKRESDKLLDIDEFKVMLKIAEPRDFTLLWLGATSGGRLQEMVRLKRVDVDLEKCTLRRRLSKRDPELDDEERIVAFSPSILAPIHDYVSRCKMWLFPGRDGAGPLHWRTGEDVFLKLHETTRCRQRHSFHSLRHLAGSFFYEATADLLFVKWRLGHIVATDDVTELYCLGAAKRQDAEIVKNKLEPVLRKYGLLPWVKAGAYTTVVSPDNPQSNQPSYVVKRRL